MLPIGDQNPTRSRPVINYLLILANVVAFVWQYLLTSTGGEAWLVAGYGLVPARFSNDPAGEAFTLFTSMFMHGGIGHLVFNLLYLHIFGDNVEDAMGHLKYLLFYLVSGVAAGLVQVAVDPSSSVPMVGASGAIAGALGGYIVLYPRAPITVLNPVPILWLFFGLFLVLPAWVVIGLWFGGNLMSGVAELGEMESGGVAFFAHIGGFVAGMLTVRGFVLGRREEVDRFAGFQPPPSTRVYYPRR